ncbi:MAG TPA: hypothetical protein PLK12_07160 [Prolixibacteraceae bacterium]|nr:hypothetical protein [Prolixibacteraceae bacterium]
MKKWVLFLFFIPWFMLRAQITDDRSFRFEGYLFSADSLPVDAAILVSYRTLGAWRSRSDGFFSIKAQPGDSFAVAHVSFDKKVIQANLNPADQNRYYLPYSIIEIERVDIKFYDREMEYFEKNRDLINEELSYELYLSRDYDFIVNPYAPPKPPAGYVNFNFPDIIDRFIQNRKRLERKLNRLKNE